jgi:flagellar motor switch protein FliN/FliY
MPELTAANHEQVVQACQADLASIGQSLNQCFDTTFQLALEIPQAYSQLGDVADFNGPGLIVGFEVGATAMLCAIPANLPIPDWSEHPDQGQRSRLQSLAQEWSFHCLPDDLAGDNFVARVVPHLGEFITAASPVEAAMCQPIRADAAENAPGARIWLIWPVSRIPAASEAPGPVAPAATAGGLAETDLPARDLSAYARLRNLPVPVIVKLAEKKMELGQLLAIGPGAIITFEKPCEDLLDLYVNNHLYCRGEAVKIGEKFGIKVCETGSVQSRASAIAAMESRSA